MSSPVEPTESAPAADTAGEGSLDALFEPRSVAVVGVSSSAVVSQSIDSPASDATMRRRRTGAPVTT